MIFFSYDSLLPKMHTILTMPHPSSITIPVHSIFQTMMACVPQSAPAAPLFTAGASGIKVTLQGTANNAGSILESSFNDDQDYDYEYQDDNLLQLYDDMDSKSSIPSKPSTDSRKASGGAIASIYRANSLSAAKLNAASSSASNNGSGSNVNDKAKVGKRVKPMKTPGGIRLRPLSRNQTVMSYLGDIGFAGAPAGSTFHGIDVQRKRRIAETVAEMVDIVISSLVTTTKSPKSVTDE